MIPLENIAEKRTIDALINDTRIDSLYRGKIFQGFVPANTLASLNEYIYVHRISGITQDRCLDVEGDTLRNVRLQIDVADVVYANMAKRSEIVKDVLKKFEKSCIVGDTYGTIQFTSQKVMNVHSIDIIITEEEVQGG